MNISYEGGCLILSSQFLLPGWFILSHLFLFGRQTTRVFVRTVLRSAHYRLVKASSFAYNSKIKKINLRNPCAVFNDMSSVIRKAILYEKSHWLYSGNNSDSVLLAGEERCRIQTEKKLKGSGFGFGFTRGLLV